MIPFSQLFTLLGKSQYSPGFTRILDLPPPLAVVQPSMDPSSTWIKERYTTFQSYRESLLIHVIDDIVQGISFFPKGYEEEAEEGEEEAECVYKGYEGIILDKIYVTDNRATILEKFGEPFEEQRKIIGYLIENNRYNLSFLFQEMWGPNDGRNCEEIESVNIGCHEFSCYPYTQVECGKIWRSLWLTPF